MALCWKLLCAVWLVCRSSSASNSTTANVNIQSTFSYGEASSMTPMPTSVTAMMTSEAMMTSKAVLQSPTPVASNIAQSSTALETIMSSLQATVQPSSSSQAVDQQMSSLPTPSAQLSVAATEMPSSVVPSQVQPTSTQVPQSAASSAAPGKETQDDKTLILTQFEKLVYTSCEEDALKTDIKKSLDQIFKDDVSYNAVREVRIFTLQGCDGVTRARRAVAGHEVSAQASLGFNSSTVTSSDVSNTIKNSGGSWVSNITTTNLVVHAGTSDEREFKITLVIKSEVYLNRSALGDEINSVVTNIMKASDPYGHFISSEVEHVAADRSNVSLVIKKKDTEGESGLEIRNALRALLPASQTSVLKDDVNVYLVQENFVRAGQRIFPVLTGQPNSKIFNLMFTYESMCNSSVSSSSEQLFMNIKNKLEENVQKSLEGNSQFMNCTLILLKCKGEDRIMATVEIQLSTSSSNNPATAMKGICKDGKIGMLDVDEESISAQRVYAHDSSTSKLACIKSLLPKPANLYIEMEVDMSWKSFCRLRDEFRMSLSQNYDTSLGNLDPSRVKFVDLDENKVESCRAGKGYPALVLFYISKKDNDREVDEEQTQEAGDILISMVENGKTRNLGPAFENRILSVKVGGKKAEASKLSEKDRIFIGVGASVGGIMLLMLTIWTIGKCRKSPPDEKIEKVPIARMSDIEDGRDNPAFEKDSANEPNIVKYEREVADASVAPVIPVGNGEVSTTADVNVPATEDTKYENIELKPTQETPAESQATEDADKVEEESTGF